MTKYFSDTSSSMCNSDLSYDNRTPVPVKRGGADENTSPKAPRPVRPSDDSKTWKSTFGSAAVRPITCGADISTDEYELMSDVVADWFTDDKVRSQHTCSQSRVCVGALQGQSMSGRGYGPAVTCLFGTSISLSSSVSPRPICLCL